MRKSRDAAAAPINSISDPATKNLLPETLPFHPPLKNRKEREIVIDAVIASSFVDETM
jgi:hypothetical protein